MGLSPDQYWGMSCSEFLAVVDSSQRNGKENQQRHRDVLNVLRLIITIVHNTSVGKGKQKSPEDLVPFEFDTKSENIVDEKQLLKEFEENRGQR